MLVEIISYALFNINKRQDLFLHPRLVGGFRESSLCFSLQQSRERSKITRRKNPRSTLEGGEEEGDGRKEDGEGRPKQKSAFPNSKQKINY